MKPRYQQRALDVPGTEGVDKRGRNLLGRPALGHQLAQHGPQHHYQRYRAQRVAEALLHGRQHPHRSQPQRQPRRNGHQQKRQKGIHLPPADEHNERQHRQQDSKEGHAGRGVGVGAG